MAFGVMFHHFSSSTHRQSQGAINEDELILILMTLQKKFNILPAQLYYEKFIGHTLDDKDICLTFDDGLLCQWDVALPILNNMSLTAFWFVYSAVFEGAIINLEVY